MWVCAAKRRRDGGLLASVAFLSIEGLALLAGRGNCTMGALQTEWGNPVPFFELVLPPRAAKVAAPVLAGVTLTGFLIVALRPPWAGRAR